jgi:hypothetical protein
MQFSELGHVRSQLYACRSHEADLQLEVARLRQELARSEENAAALEAAIVLAESIGWRVQYRVRRHHLDDNDPPRWEAVARNRATPTEHESADGLSMAATLAALSEQLRVHGEAR